MNRLFKNPFAFVQKVAVVALCVVLAGSFSSCAKRAESSGEVPFKPCPCENSEDTLQTIKGEARLFLDDSYKEWTSPNAIAYVPYHGDHIFLLTRKQENDIIVYWGYVCNFPDFAKEWNTPGGVNVYYEGISYVSCEGFGIRQDRIYGSVILTKLKKNE